MPDLRRHPLSGELVVIAPGRLGRPGALGRTVRRDEADRCPFCEGHEGLTPPELATIAARDRLPDTPGWIVRTVPNKYPALPGQEVVVHGGAHLLHFADVPAAVAEAAVATWIERVRLHLSAGASDVLVGINEGAGAGASLAHSHSQVVPFAELPPATALRRRAFAAGCPLCGPPGDVVARHGPVAVTCPPWSRRPYELLIAPGRHESWPSEPSALASALLDATARLRARLGDELDWNAILHLPPAGDDGEHHWHVELLPRLTVAASLELGAGVWVNVVDPAEAASTLAG